MVASLSVAFLFILVLMTVLFRSIRVGLFSMIPNVWPVFITLAMLGYLEIDLRVSSVIIFSVSLGIAVDDTIHFLSKLRLQLAQGRTLAAAVKRSFLATGKAIVVTSLILCGGFMTLTTSSFLGTFHIGLLISLTLLFAVVADLTFLPWMVLRWFRPKV